MRLLVAMTLCVAAGCTDPALNARLRLGPNGLTLRPSVSARVGGLGVAVSP
jgi:hypothetical protein